MVARTLYSLPTCPKCGRAENKVKNTYYTKDGRIARTRTCDWCNWKWWTVQNPESNIDPARYLIHIPSFRTYSGSRKQLEIRQIND